MDRLLDLVAASLLPGIGAARAAYLLKTLGPDAGAAALADVLPAPPEGRRKAVDDACRQAERALARGRELGAQTLHVGGPDYPAWLATIVDPPIVLWVQGDAAALDRPGVAVVGSRRPSAAGVLLAEGLSRQVAEAGFVVTSGLARGIDGAAHRGALDGGGCTVAVLGSGLDTIYPADHGPLAARIRRSGCLVTEFAPAVPARTYHFPQRNRVISGLSRLVVVVEAAEKSGSLITARMALEQGRGVGAVPGNVQAGRSRGCHALIKDGARLVETVEDVLEELGWQRPLLGPQVCVGKSLSGNILLDAMTSGSPESVEELAIRTGLSGGAFFAEIGALELAGRVRRLPGGLLVRLD